MRKLPVLLLRLVLLIAIAASSALVVEHTNAGDPAFCGVTSGCFAVRLSAWSRPFGIPMPSIGLAAYASLFCFAFVAKKRVQHMAVAGLASVGALFALFLLWLQKNQIGAFCAWCVAVDISAIVAAIAAVWIALAAKKDEASVLLPARREVSLAWMGAAMLAVIAPFVWGRYPNEPALPQAVAAEQVPGKLTIVGFTDFECPHCRRLHPAIHDVVARYGDKVRVIRKMNPLAGHPGAEPAALGYLCTPEANREAVADALYTAPHEELTSEGVVKILEKQGVAADGLAECMRSPATRAQLEEDKKLFVELGGRGLPFTFVGHRVVLGNNPDRLQTAAAQAFEGEHLSLPVWAMFALLGGVFLGAIVVTMKAAQRPGSV